MSKESCEHCTGNDKLLKKELTLTKEIIIHLILFSLQDGKLVKIDNLNLCAIPKTKISVCGQSYRVMNAIFHHGSCIEDGHYTSIRREGISNWIEANDLQVGNRHWPRGGKDIYILFLQKIDNR